MAIIQPGGSGDGGGFTNPMTTAGDLIVGGTAGAPTRLAAGAAGTFLGGTGTTYQLPPGHEFDYVQITSSVTVTATADGNNGGTAVIDGNAVTYDGSTRVKIEFGTPFGDYVEASGNQNLLVNVYDGTTDLGRICNMSAVSATFAAETPLYGVLFVTPTAAAHTFHIRSWKTQTGGTAQIGAGPGGASAYGPAWYRITKA